MSKEDYEIIELVDQPQPRNSKVMPIPFNINVHSFNDEHKHIDFSFLLKSKTEKLNPGQDESQEIGWFSIKEIKELNKQKKLHDSTLDICEWLLAKQM